MGRKRSSPVTQLFLWIRGQSTKVKIFLAAVPLLFSLVALKLLVKDHNHFFIASELIHVAGISVLAYKLTTKKTCSEMASLLELYVSMQDSGRLGVVPSAILAVLIHPYNTYIYISQVLWAFCVYLEAVSVLPQLRMMQNAKVYETGGRYLFLVGAGHFWFPVAVFAEIVQTFILADFCYYYIKSFMEGRLIMRMPV
ncbi:ER lumen protein retaining receptor - like 2 [Theobroma cacao]|nr:ER lumen protein retaining receptor - like 2 [Theobroma cacao]